MLDNEIKFNSIFSKKTVYDMNSDRVKKRMAQMQKRRACLADTISPDNSKKKLNNVPLNNDDISQKPNKEIEKKINLNEDLLLSPSTLTNSNSNYTNNNLDNNKNSKIETNIFYPIDTPTTGIIESKEDDDIEVNISDLNDISLEYNDDNNDKDNNLENILNSQINNNNNNNNNNENVNNKNKITDMNSNEFAIQFLSSNNKSFIHFNNNLVARAAAQNDKNTPSYILALCPELMYKSSNEKNKEIIQENYAVKDIIKEEDESPIKIIKKEEKKIKFDDSINIKKNNNNNESYINNINVINPEKLNINTTDSFRSNKNENNVKKCIHKKALSSFNANLIEMKNNIFDINKNLIFHSKKSSLNNNSLKILLNNLNQKTSKILHYKTQSNICNSNKGYYTKYQIKNKNKQIQSSKPIYHTSKNSLINYKHKDYYNKFNNNFNNNINFDKNNYYNHLKKKTHHHQKSKTSYTTPSFIPLKNDKSYNNPKNKIYYNKTNNYFNKYHNNKILTKNSFKLQDIKKELFNNKIINHKKTKTGLMYPNYNLNSNNLINIFTPKSESNFSLSNKNMIFSAMQRLKFCPISIYCKALNELNKSKKSLFCLSVYNDKNNCFAFKGLYEINNKDHTIAEKIYSSGYIPSKININEIKLFYNFDPKRGEFYKYRFNPTEKKQFNSNIIIII